jgi:hypothetical protein
VAKLDSKVVVAVAPGAMVALDAVRRRRVVLLVLRVHLGATLP